MELYHIFKNKIEEKTDKIHKKKSIENIFIRLNKMQNKFEDICLTINYFPILIVQFNKTHKTFLFHFIKIYTL